METKGVNKRVLTWFIQKSNIWLALWHVKNISYMALTYSLHFMWKNFIIFLPNFSIWTYFIGVYVWVFIYAGCTCV